jgi:hypothetical protein
MRNLGVEVPNPVQLLSEYDVAVVDDEIKFETVKLFDDVAMRESPSAEDVMMELAAKLVTFVPPFAIGNVPVT